MRIKTIILLFGVLSSTVADCRPGSKSAGYVRVENAQPGWNKNLEAGGVLYDLYLPENVSKFNGMILVLPGWNFPRQSWIENTSLEQKARESGYILVLPEMGKTLYETSYFPETRTKWGELPGSVYIKTVLIPHLQKVHKIAVFKHKNLLLGLSTGGRGVAMTILENPDVFAMGAALSGDFAQNLMPKDRIMTNVYGSFDKFPDRWNGRDNILSRASEINVPLYLAHGLADKVVPENQSMVFFSQMQLLKKDIIYEALEAEGHDYKFWNKSLDRVFLFYEGKLKMH